MVDMGYVRIWYLYVCGVRFSRIFGRKCQLVSELEEL